MCVTFQSLYYNLLTEKNLIGSPTDYHQARDFFKHRFTKLNTNKEKFVYVHFTVATDTKLLAHVMESVSDSILHENVQTLLL